MRQLLSMAREAPLDLLLDGFTWLFRRVPVWWCMPIAIIVSLAVYAGFLALAGVLAGGLPGDVGEINDTLRLIGALFAGVLGMAVLISGLMAHRWKRRRNDLFAQNRNLEAIRKLSWREFEILIGEAFRQQGYQVFERGGAGPDGGVDLDLKGEGEKVLVQCKHYRSAKIGVKAVRELYGVVTGEEANRSIFVSSHGYTDDAKAFADGKPIELIDGEGLAEFLGKDVHGTASAEPMATELQTSDVPECPRCGEPMVKRTAKRGANAGQSFFGCVDYRVAGERGRANHFGLGLLGVSPYQWSCRIPESLLGNPKRLTIPDHERRPRIPPAKRPEMPVAFIVRADRAGSLFKSKTFVEPWIAQHENGCVAERFHLERF